MTTRRQFLDNAAVAGGSALIAQSALPDIAWGATPSPMNILILGGPGYIGPHLVVAIAAITAKAKEPAGIG